MTLCIYSKYLLILVSSFLSWCSFAACTLAAMTARSSAVSSWPGPWRTFSKVSALVCILCKGTTSRTFSNCLPFWQTASWGHVHEEEDTYMRRRMHTWGSGYIQCLPFWQIASWGRARSWTKSDTPPPTSYMHTWHTFSQVSALVYILCKATI